MQEAAWSSLPALELGGRSGCELVHLGDSTDPSAIGKKETWSEWHSPQRPQRPLQPKAFLLQGRSRSGDT